MNFGRLSDSLSTIFFYSVSSSPAQIADSVAPRSATRERREGLQRCDSCRLCAHWQVRCLRPARLDPSLQKLLRLTLARTRSLRPPNGSSSGTLGCTAATVSGTSERQCVYGAGGALGVTGPFSRCFVATKMAENLWERVQKAQHLALLA
jgi:hypothetical protein